VESGRVLLSNLIILKGQGVVKKGWFFQLSARKPLQNGFLATALRGVHPVGRSNSLGGRGRGDKACPCA